MRYFGVILSLFTAFVCLPSAQTQTFTILHTFQSADGANPQAGVIQDSSGNLYGTAENGGTYGAGTVYKITPKGKFSVLHSFGGTTTDGDGPTAPLLLDDNGNLYGTTLAGGEDCVAGSNFGCGTVFKINSSGKESILHDFTGGDPSSLDGKTPFSGLIADNNSDAMFGTTWGGYNGSVVYEITPAGKETILYTLNNNTTLYGSLVQDNNGDLWGTSGAPPATAAGTELAKSTAARFSNSTKLPKAGSKPRLIALLAASMEPIPGRALFMTASGASSTALPGWAALTRPAGTRRCWAGAAFCSSSIPPASNLILDPAGNIYGTTALEGPGYGTVFAYTIWGQFITLHTFPGGADGAYPESSLLLDRKKAVIYGTTSEGGDPTCQWGVVFSIAP
jgi:uncharacterized repeat protein (TIGR03803 family)